MKTKIITLFAIVTTMVSCNSTKKTDSVTDKDATTDTEMDNVITDKYWKLVTLEGQAVTMVEGQEREAFFTLKSNDKTVNGFAGCNSFSGEYTLEDGNRIKFGTLATTMKICDGVKDEQNFMQVLDQADNYTIVNDELSLNVGRRAPLAVFKAVYMK